MSDWRYYEISLRVLITTELVKGYTIVTFLFLFLNLTDNMKDYVNL